MSKKIVQEVLSVDPRGSWRQYASSLPAGSVAIGTVVTGAGVGALVRLPKLSVAGAYLQIIGNVQHGLDGRKVAAALGLSGRPAELVGGKKVNTYLDAKSVKVALKLGGGNVSEGIRRALAKAEQYQEAQTWSA